MKNIVILLSAMLFMVACEKGNEEMKEAKVVVSVYDENGKIATGVPVKMYNEKDYKVFEKDNLTLKLIIGYLPNNFIIFYNFNTSFFDFFASCFS